VRSCAKSGLSCAERAQITAAGFWIFLAEYRRYSLDLSFRIIEHVGPFRCLAMEERRWHLQQREERRKPEQTSRGKDGRPWKV
jgi:hypothetical protein